MLTRRHFLLSSLAAVAQRARRPNVLFIATDDMNNALGCYGHPAVKTPHLDRLAARGVRFDRAYCQFALCSPSRSSLMTGLGPDTTTVYNLQKHFRSVIPNAVTLSQCFKNNGYYAARVGKIYHYGNPGDIGTDGLDDAPSWSHKVNPKGIDKAEEPLLTNHTPARKGLGSALAFYASPAPDEQHTDGMVAAEIIKLMEQHKDGPFFLAAGFYRPHCPYIAPKKYFDLYQPEKLEPIPLAPDETKIAPPWAYFTNPPNWNMTRRQTQEVLQAYYASISFVDANVGKLLDALERLGLAENTIVVFWSDHGYGTGEHGQWMKQTLFEAATRMPLIIAAPGTKAKGKGSPRPVELLDLYPTLADLCGLKDVPANLHGASLRPLLNNPGAKWDRPAISQVARGPKVMGYSIRTERYRYTEWNGGQEGEELYDYQTDPNELKNLAKSERHAKQKAELLARLRAATKARGRK
ncbi:MAG: sulfatase [Bryobacterales bacterium]|nr:sulfatase [Bryobacterales bacterium]